MYLKSPLRGSNPYYLLNDVLIKHELLRGHDYLHPHSLPVLNLSEEPLPVFLLHLISNLLFLSLAPLKLLCIRSHNLTLPDITESLLLHSVLLRSHLLVQVRPRLKLLLLPQLLLGLLYRLVLLKLFLTVFLCQRYVLTNPFLVTPCCMQFLLNDLDPSLIFRHHLLRLVFLLLKQLIQHVLVLNREVSGASLYLDLVNRIDMTQFDLLIITRHHLSLRKNSFLHRLSLLLLDLPLKVDYPLIISLLLLPIHVLLAIVLFNLHLSQLVLLTDLPCLCVLPLLLHFSSLFLLPQECQLILLITPLLLLLGQLVLMHLLLQVFLHLGLLFSLLLAHGLTVLVELVNVVLDDLGPIVVVGRKDLDTT